MHRVIMQSRTIASVAYEESEQLLEVELKDGEIRRFPNAPKYLFLGLVSAKSPSKFYQTIIKDRTFERVFPSGRHRVQN